jgi:hypothetical protein
MPVRTTIAGAVVLLAIGAGVGGVLARNASQAVRLASLKDSCGADVLFVGVRGSGETTEGAGLGTTNFAVEGRLSTLLRPLNVVAEPVDYPAVNIFTRVVASGAHGIEVYRQSESAGEEQLINTLYLWHHKCPNYRFVISGYSQGAHAVGNVMTTLAQDPKDADVFRRIAGAVLFGDPIYNPNDPVAVSPPNHTQVGVMASYLAAASGPRPVYQPPLNSMIRSWCAAGDPICSSYPPLAAAQLAACGIPHAPCPHLHYVDGATDDGARFLADRIRAASTTGPGSGGTASTANPQGPPPPAAAGHDCMAFVADLTVPDGTTAAAGQVLTKTWRLRNCGNTNWSGLTAVRTAGTFGPASFPIPVTPPGATADVTTAINAPATPGTARATYRLRASDGHYADHEFWIELHVATAGPATTLAAPQPPPPGDGQIPPADDPGQTPLPAGSHRLGPIDLDRYCGAWGLRAMLRFPNTWGWRCATSTVPADGNRVGDQNISTIDACTQQYGANAVSHYTDYRQPDSWSCWAG